MKSRKTRIAMARVRHIGSMDNPIGAKPDRSAPSGWFRTNRNDDDLKTREAEKTVHYAQD
jgi:hypothetical protein